jgi:hypothetical protein
MLLRRAYPSTEDCPSGRAGCNTDPSSISGKDDSVYYLSKSGLHRYIGLTMVAALALLIFVWWWLHARQSRSKDGAGRDESEDGAELALPKLPPSSLPRRSWFCIGKRKLSTRLQAPPDLEMSAQGDKEVVVQEQRVTKTSEIEVKIPRWMSQSKVPKGLVKEVSGGMVIYTNRNSDPPGPTRPKSTVPPPRDRYSRSLNPNEDWHMEYTSGVQYEVGKTISTLHPCTEFSSFAGRNTARGSQKFVKF